MKKSIGAVVLLVTAFLYAGCGQPTPQPPPVITKPPQVVTPVPPPPKPEWQQKWDATLAEAKKEGKLNVYALWGQEPRAALSQAFRDKYGIDVEFTSFARGSEMLAKVQTENRAGLNIADVFGSGGGTFISAMKPAGVLGNIKSLLFLPEVVDPKMWRGGKLTFSDKDGTTIPMVASAQRFMIYNTNLVQKGELTAYEDALKPQYKGKISLNDPRVTGSGSNLFSHLALNIWNVEKTRDFLTRVVRDQEAEIIRDNRLQVEVIAKGKHSIGLGARVATQAEFLDAGAPIAQVQTDEVYSSHADGVLGIPTKSAHPNATIIFVNWLLSKEGQAVFVKSTLNPSLRLDAPTEGINPIFFTRPEEKLYPDSEEDIIFRGKFIVEMKGIIAEAEKGK